MAGREVGQPVVPADRLHVVDVAGAAKVAGGRQVDLERGVAQVAATEKNINRLSNWLLRINLRGNLGSRTYRSFISPITKRWTKRALIIVFFITMG